MGNPGSDQCRPRSIEESEPADLVRDLAVPRPGRHVPNRRARSGSGTEAGTAPRFVHKLTATPGDRSAYGRWRPRAGAFPPILYSFGGVAPIKYRTKSSQRRRIMSFESRPY